MAEYVGKVEFQFSHESTPRRERPKNQSISVSVQHGNVNKMLIKVQERYHGDKKREKKT